MHGVVRWSGLEGWRRAMPRARAREAISRTCPRHVWALKMSFVFVD